MNNRIVYTGPTYSINTNTGNMGVVPPPRRYSFNEHTMMFADLATGERYRVRAFGVVHSVALMAEVWRFDCFNHDGRIVSFQPLPGECEAYLKEGTRVPRSFEEEYYNSFVPVRQDQVSPTSQEDTDMLRNHFTFDYTGDEIADAIEIKIAEIHDKIAKATEHDLDALVEAGLIDSGKKALVEQTITNHQSRIETWEREARPYRKAGSQEFSLDAEDVAHFGL